MDVVTPLLPMNTGAMAAFTSRMGAPFAGMVQMLVPPAVEVQDTVAVYKSSGLAVVTGSASGVSLKSPAKPPVF